MEPAEELPGPERLLAQVGHQRRQLGAGAGAQVGEAPGLGHEATTCRPGRAGPSATGAAPASRRAISTRVTRRSSPPRTVKASPSQEMTEPTGGTRPAVAVTKPPSVS